MPCSRQSPADDDLGVSTPTHGGSVKSRYNDMSAWAIFGLARSYASFIGLDRGALVPFSDDASAGAAKIRSLDRMRVWLNMVTYDCNLTLTSGLPVSLDWTSAHTAARRFSSHPLSQMPGDLRYAAMIDLISIIQRVRRSKADVVDRQDVIVSIKRANVELDDWERCVAYIAI